MIKSVCSTDTALRPTYGLQSLVLSVIIGNIVHEFRKGRAHISGLLPQVHALFLQRTQSVIHDEELVFYCTSPSSIFSVSSGLLESHIRGLK